jgi:DNA-binding CsgD family transcriptional regulator
MGSVGGTGALLSLGSTGMAWDSKAARAVELIYDSVDAEQGWMPLLEVLADQSDATGAHIFLQHQGTGEFIEDCLFGADEDAQKGYQRLAHTDPSMPLSMQNPGAIINDVDHFSDAFFESTALYNEVMKQQDARYRTTSVLPLDNDTIAGFAVIRSKSMGGFEDEHVDRLELLLPHMVRALRLQRRLRRLEHEAQNVVAALDRLPTAALIVSESLEIICVNRQADELMASSDALRTRHGAVVVEKSSEANALKEAVSDAVALADGPADINVGPPAVVTISRGAKLPLEVLAVPLRPRYRLRREADHQARLMLLIYDPSSLPTIEPVLVGRLFDLTATEAIVASRLAGGCTLAEIAQQRRCSKATVRTHIKNIFRKTDINRQSELVQLILTSPAVSFTG